MKVKPWQSASSLQLTRSGWTQTELSRVNQCKSDHESLREDLENEDRPDSFCRDPFLGSAEVNDIDRSKPQRDILNYAH